jgi:hypothetical protein
VVSALLAGPTASLLVTKRTQMPPCTHNAQREFSGQALCGGAHALWLSSQIASGRAGRMSAAAMSWLQEAEEDKKPDPSGGIGGAFASLLTSQYAK